MVNLEDILLLTQALEKASKVIADIAEVQLQHNTMLMDLYERISKLEETNESKNTARED